MAKLQLMASIVFVALTATAVHTVRPTSVDELLNSEGLFDSSLPQTSVNINFMGEDELTFFQRLLDNATVLQNAYTTYLLQYKKETGISTLDSFHRPSIFREKLLYIFEHNLEARAGRSSFEMGVNQFSDMTFEEFAAGYLGYEADNGTISVLSEIPESLPKRSRAIAPDIDWRALGHVTPVKNQGGCGSCVPFAATACLESSHSIWHNRQHLDLSEQELIDCSRGNGNNGCSGGTFVPTFDYLKNKGQGIESSYPYESRDGSCRSGGKARYARVTGWWRVLPQGDENKLKEAVNNYGPIAVAVHVNSAFQSYKSGIFQAPCSGGRNHAGLVVGYNGYMGTDYWIFKNSWGSGWGESGYIRIRRHFGNLCDIAGDAVLINA